MTIAAPQAQAEPASVLLDWLGHLYDDVDNGWLTLLAVDSDTGDRHVHWAPVDDYDALVDAVMRLEPTCCVWLGVATRTDEAHRRLARQERRGGDADCACIPAMWVDIDIAGPGHKTGHPLPPNADAALELLAAFPLPPTAVVNSGGGLQAWWQFDEPQRADQLGPLLARWGHTWTEKGRGFGWHVDNVFDTARIMRLPGTTNRKTDTPRPVEIISADWARRYGVDDIDQWLEDIPAPPAPAPSSLVDRVPYIGPERPGDAFNAHHTGAGILAAAGWTLHHRDRNGDEHWTRPGKDTKQGASATVYADDGHTTVWSDTVRAGTPSLELRRPYDPFGLYTHLHHRGDWAASSDALVAQGYGSKPRHGDDLSWIGAETPAPAAELAPPADDTVPGSTWRPTPLRDILDGLAAGTIERPHPTVGRFSNADMALYYRGRVNGLYGESGKGKSWIALALAAEALADGGTVAWIDLEEPAEGVLARLLDIGVDPDAIADRFLHFAPEESIRTGAALFAALDAQPPTLAVIDSTGEALTLESANPNSDDEVATWFRAWPRRIATQYGACVIVIDHVVKDEMSRGLFPGGSQRKRAAITGSAFMVDAAKTLGQGVKGVLKLTCAKDRAGNHRQGKKIAEFVLDGTGARTAWHIEAPVVPGEGAPFRPTTLMERVSRHLAANPDAWLSSRSITANVSGNEGHLRTALDALVDTGHVERRSQGQALLHRHTKPFDVAQDFIR